MLRQARSGTRRRRRLTGSEAALPAPPLLPPDWSVRFTLDWPPSTNRVWRTTATGRVLLSQAAKTYREAVAWALTFQKIPRVRAAVPLSLELVVRVKDRARDIDNLLKATLDALTHAGLISDDRCIDELHVRRDFTGDYVAPLLVTLRRIQRP